MAKSLRSSSDKKTRGTVAWEHLRHNLVMARTKARLSQTGLAKRSGVSRPTISRLERTDVPNVSIKTIERLARALHSDVAGLTAPPVGGPVPFSAARAHGEHASQQRLYATKGIHPREFWDNNEEDTFNSAWRMGMLDDQKDGIRATKAKLLHDFYEPAEIERIIHGVQLTDAQVWAFMHVWAGVLRGEILTGGLVLPAPPTQEQQLHPNLSDDGRYPIQFQMIPSEKASVLDDHIVRVTGALRMQKTIMCSREDDCDGNHPPESQDDAWVENAQFALDVGSTSATRTFALLKMGIPVARWMQGSAYLHLLMPTPAFETRFASSFEDDDDDEEQAETPITTPMRISTAARARVDEPRVIEKYAVDVRIHAKISLETEDLFDDAYMLDVLCEILHTTETDAIRIIEDLYNGGALVVARVSGTLANVTAIQRAGESLFEYFDSVDQVTHETYCAVFNDEEWSEQVLELTRGEEPTHLLFFDVASADEGHKKAELVAALLQRVLHHPILPDGTLVVLNVDSNEFDALLPARTAYLQVARDAGFTQLQEPVAGCRYAVAYRAQSPDVFG